MNLLRQSKKIILKFEISQRHLQTPSKNCLSEKLGIVSKSEQSSRLLHIKEEGLAAQNKESNNNRSPNAEHASIQTSG